MVCVKLDYGSFTWIDLAKKDLMCRKRGSPPSRVDYAISPQVKLERKERMELWRSTRFLFEIVNPLAIV